MSRQQIDCSNGFQDACDAIDRYNRCIGAAISVAQTQYPATSGETAASAGQSLVLETLNALRDQLSPSVGTLVGVVANTAKIASVVNTVVTCHRPTTAASERDPHNEAGQLGTSICPTAPQRRRHGVPGGSASVERGALLITDAEWRPIAFAILLSKLGRLEGALEQLDPAPVVAEIAQRAEDRGLPPFAPPEPWPVETWSLIPLRAALVADEQGRLREFSRAAYRKSFVESRSLAELDNVLAAAQEVGLEPDEVRDGIERPEIKERLKGNTEQALAVGVTGIPTVAMGDELFWGDDRLDEAAGAVTR